jgi:uncharacterized protein (TIGR00369 family)
MDLKTQHQYGLVELEKIESRTGREVLQAIIDGVFPQPPIAQALTFWLAEVGDGLAVFEAEAGRHLLNFSGVAHGGWGLTLIDSATGCAAFSTLPAGVGFTTIETKANFNRPITQDSGRVRCEGRVLSAGRRIITADATLKSMDGRIVAHGTSTIMVLDGGNKS